MKTSILPPWALAGLGFALASCATSPQYPYTYQVPLAPAQVTSAYGPPDLPVNGVQDVPAQSGSPLYYEIASATPIQLYAFDKNGSSPGGSVLGRFQGTSFASSVVPSGDTVEFVVSALQPVTGGSVQLTVSDSPVGTGPQQNEMGGAQAQAPVALSPSNVTVAEGQTVTFTAMGGAGSGNYVWGGCAAASGTANEYTFNAPGTYSVTVYRAGDSDYAQSNLAEATVTVSPPASYPPVSSGAPPAVNVTPVR